MMNVLSNAQAEVLLILVFIYKNYIKCLIFDLIILSIYRKV